jgi:hypothetical protein
MIDSEFDTDDDITKLNQQTRCKVASQIPNIFLLLVNI